MPGFGSYFEEERESGRLQEAKEKSRSGLSLMVADPGDNWSLPSQWGLTKDTNFIQTFIQSKECEAIVKKVVKQFFIDLGWVQAAREVKGEIRG